MSEKDLAAIWHGETDGAPKPRWDEGRASNRVKRELTPEEAAAKKARSDLFRARVRARAEAGLGTRREEAAKKRAARACNHGWIPAPWADAMECLQCVREKNQKRYRAWKERKEKLSELTEYARHCHVEVDGKECGARLATYQTPKTTRTYCPDCRERDKAASEEFRKTRKELQRALAAAKRKKRDEEARKMQLELLASRLADLAKR